MRTSRGAVVATSIASLFVFVSCYQPELLPAPSHTRIHTDCGYRYQDPFGYTAQQITAPDDLPPTIRSALTSHLIARLGESFYGTLQLSGGEIIDLDELARLNPQLVSHDREVPSYILHFHLLRFDPEAEYPFCAQIELNDRGNAIKEITLPRVAHDRSKADIVSRQIALERARDEGLETDNAWVELGYDSSIDSMVWLISKTTGSDRSHFWGVTLHLDAHTGRFLRWSDYSGYV